ncbi:MAG TPA: 4'-phosphopantetheinyl transferase superfamily protein, partial [Streptosporangiaceae bacterium]|nr:4'-phosphopantetheinyl transferase superfamily protein [Streptosporangiaceae bacterium]
QPAETGIDLSISYAEEALAVAISDIYDVGVDIEVLNGRGPHAIAWGALTPAERTELAAAPADQQLARFLLTWTAKEALVKSTGLGISVDFAGVHPPPTATGIHKDQNQNHWLHQQQWSNRERAYYVSVAARNRTWPGPGVSEPV